MIEITDLDIQDKQTPEIFCGLTESSLRRSADCEHGLFIAESPKVIRLALARGYEPHSLLCERKHLAGDAADIIAALDALDATVEVYTGSRERLAGITGYKLTRGVLCAMRRRELPSPCDVCRGARLVAVMQSVTDTTNVGSIFRAAAALGVDAVIVSADNCDPLNRRAVRVSMGNVFSVPWTVDHDPVGTLRSLGFSTAALALAENSISLADPKLKEAAKLAVIFGTEGDGLPDDIISRADHVVKIPMHHGVDSLNVASAAAVTFWELRRR